MNGFQNNQDKKIYSLLGICRKAGCIKAGEFQTEKAVKTGLAFLVIVAEDASENTKKRFNEGRLRKKLEDVIPELQERSDKLYKQFNMKTRTLSLVALLAA